MTLSDVFARVVYLATTTFVWGCPTTETAEGRVQAYTELYDMVEKRHKFFVSDILPLLRAAGKEASCIRDTQSATVQLKIQGSRRNVIVGNLARASREDRNSPTFMFKQIDDAMINLRTLDENTLTNTTRGDDILAELGDAVFSLEGATIEDEMGNQLTYRAARAPSQPDDAGNTIVPREEHHAPSLPDNDAPISFTSQVVCVR